ncbi:MAG: GH3 auxin-responsive promoter family protein [Muribaculaceae bacterium]|nr:GH3 auxin-responsive promoter family protein [Muribaculaceae bacterium]
MLDLTPLARPWFSRLTHRSDSWTGHIRETQLRVLSHILRRGAATKWGAAHGLDGSTDYDTLRRAFPSPVPYSTLRPWVMRMVSGEADVLWPGVTRRFAQSSGTSDGKSKYIPITPEGLSLSHYAGGAHAVASYLNLYPDSRLFSGRSFILGGSFANELTLPPGVKVGDLSATLIDCINPLAELVRVPGKKIALMEDWARKLPALVEASISHNVTNISGVPSWFLTVLRRVLEHTGAPTLRDVWPGLEVFFHGGISMAPYRSQYAAIAPGMRYLECYNASEGFFAVQDTIDNPAMRLLLDCGTFLEFIPQHDVLSDTPEILPAWCLEEGRVYGLLLTSVNGLWRFPVGDTVRIESLEPLRVTIAGRTRSFINAFGEELMVENAEAALARVCTETGATIANYTAAPVYASDGKRGRHEWLIEFSRRPESLPDFASRLDSALRSLNSDYDAKRTGDIFLDPLTIVVGRRGVFDAWLSSTGKLGGQRKIPRLSNTRHPMDEILALNKSGQ